MVANASDTVESVPGALFLGIESECKMVVIGFHFEQGKRVVTMVDPRMAIDIGQQMIKAAFDFLGEKRDTAEAEIEPHPTQDAIVMRFERAASGIGSEVVMPVHALPVFLSEVAAALEVVHKRACPGESKPA